MSKLSNTRLKKQVPELGGASCSLIGDPQTMDHHFVRIKRLGTELAKPYKTLAGTRTRWLASVPPATTESAGENMIILA